MKQGDCDMFRNRKRRLLVVLMVVVTLLASGMTTLAASSEVKLSGFNVPSSVVVGHGITVKGTVSSNVTIRRIEVGVVNASTNSWTQSRYDNPNVNAKSFDLSKAASKMAVSRMGKGTYKYRIYAIRYEGGVTASSAATTLTVMTKAYPVLTFKVAKRTQTAIKLSWTKALNSSGYVLYRSYEKDGKLTEYKKYKKVKGTGFTDKNLRPATVYRYRVYSYRTALGLTSKSAGNAVKTVTVIPAPKNRRDCHRESRSALFIRIERKIFFHISDRSKHLSFPRAKILL